MKLRFSEYWVYQFVGWGVFISINLFFAFIYDKLNATFTARLLIFVGLGLLFTHVMRYLIRRSNIMIQPLQQQIVGFVFITLVFAFAVGLLETWS